MSRDQTRTQDWHSKVTSPTILNQKKPVNWFIGHCVPVKNNKTFQDGGQDNHRPSSAHNNVKHQVTEEMFKQVPRPEIDMKNR